MNDWPVRFILDSASWQRGYDLAMEQAEKQSADDLTSPFDMLSPAFFGFDEGRRDAKVALHGRVPTH